MVRSEVLRTVTASAKLRCAVYTRKSSEEGVDQEFNSLDAQREACTAFIASQVGLGWKLVPNGYDDGGISGGTMERAALQQLLQDIRDRKIDVVVVYKIDRLTRSLMDFSKIVDIFDGHNVSFVSVTQQFNTTTSMGRLTLNVLLSFAQFEREVTAERIRDKIAASKKKGMWMGGTVPLGYQVRERKLIAKEPEAGFVRSLFERYTQLRSVPALAETITREAATADNSDRKDSAEPFTRTARSGMLYKLLSNPIYIGKLRHRDNVYDGEQQPIIDVDLFERVQALLAMQAPVRKGSRVHPDIHLLTGILFDETGDRLSPAHATNHGKRYRYYVSSRLKAAKRKVGDRGWRIPALELEDVVAHQALKLLEDRSQLAGWIQEHASSDQAQLGLDTADRLIIILADAGSLDRKRTLLRTMFRRVTLEANTMRFTVDVRALVRTLIGSDLSEPSNSSYPHADSALSPATIVVPLSLKRRGNEARLIIESGVAQKRSADETLVDLIARAHLYLAKLTEGPEINIGDVASIFGVHRADVSRVLPLAFLAPRITEAILVGRQPVDLSARKLARINLPTSWRDQLAALN